MKNLPGLFLIQVVAALGALVGLAGCASYTDKTQSLRSAWSAGNVQQAAQIAEKQAEKNKGNGDALLWDLEDGAATRASAQFNDSLAAFNRADALIVAWEKKPAVSVSAEIAAAMVNQTVLPYRGTAYDKIMESTYQALNYMQVGKFDEARVELNRALDRQRDAVAANAARIAKAKDEASVVSQRSEQNPEDPDNYNVERAQSDPKLSAQLDRAYAPLNSMRAYAPYVNPFSVYLYGLYFLARGETPSDWQRARVSLNQVRQMIGPNPYIDADCALADQLAAGSPLPELTYVIYETGMAPIREQIRIDIPLFIVTQEVPYVGVAFPHLKFNGQFNPGVSVRGANGEPVNTLLLSDMDAIIAQEFKNDLPSIIIKTLISAGAKAGAQYGLYTATKNSGTLGTIIQIGGVIYQVATNNADLRTWVTLPKQFVFARLPTPADRKLQLTPQSTGVTQTIDLPPGAVTMVYVKSNSYGERLLIHAFTLR